VSGVLVHDDWDLQTREALARLKPQLDRDPSHVLHFRNLTHAQRLKTAQEIAWFPLATITNVIVHKDLIGQPKPAGNTAFISRPDPMYLWALRLLLERVSWYVASKTRIGRVIATFSKVRGFPDAKLHAYRKALELTAGVEIDWTLFHRFRVAVPGTVELLQVADATASATYHAVEPYRYGNRHPQYLQALRPRLYRRAGGEITSYGLKVFPSEEAQPGGSLHWLRGY
jgi:hypothetical protein